MTDGKRQNVAGLCTLLQQLCEILTRPDSFSCLKLNEIAT